MFGCVTSMYERPELKKSGPNYPIVKCTVLIRLVAKGPGVKRQGANVRVRNVQERNVRREAYRCKISRSERSLCEISESEMSMCETSLSKIPSCETSSYETIWDETSGLEMSKWPGFEMSRCETSVCTMTGSGTSSEKPMSRSPDTKWPGAKRLGSKVNVEKRSGLNWSVAKLPGSKRPWVKRRIRNVYIRKTPGSGSETSMFETSRLGPKRPCAKRPVTRTSRSEMSRCDTFGSETSMCELDAFKVLVSVRWESSIKRPLEESMCELPRSESSRCVLPWSEISGCGDVRVWTVQIGCDLNIIPGLIQI